MHSVELLPDGATERAVRDVWDRLLRAGLPSQAAHRHPTNRPHLTLATAEVLEPGTRARLDEALAALPLPLVLRGTVRFTGRIHVLAWAVRRDEACCAYTKRCGGPCPAHRRQGGSTPFTTPRAGTRTSPSAAAGAPSGPSRTTSCSGARPAGRRVS
ncbi:2'-5' RNA ligase family protein [Streptomyces sudanensis]|uniref:2'-5' RNA ligase family protein n=1 Tax=Streptomyces sudanensis TaxID=436397 RepID=UPI0020CDFD05|nr:2'-5' RNA ligase family protein [Streptomyces sudanensis]MCQ0003163.1 2'-5' RNA ligase family protein [Streptomyces sudanensis]